VGIVLPLMGATVTVTVVEEPYVALAAGAMFTVGSVVAPLVTSTIYGRAEVEAAKLLSPL